MKGLVPVNAFTSPVRCIEDGDALSNAVFQEIIQVLANRTEFNNLVASVHAALTAPHGAVATATASRLALRDAAGKLAGDILGNAATATNATNHINAFAQSITHQGYQKLPSGLIIQWGAVVYADISYARDVLVTFPITFPNYPLTFSASADTTQNQITVSQRNMTTSNVVVGLREFDTTAAGGTVFWFALGY